MTLPPGITTDKLQELINALRHCVVLGIKVKSYDNGQIMLELPYSESIIGNPETRVIHGGALTTLLDTTCGLSVPLSLNEFKPSPTLDLRIDYMTQATPGQAIYAKAETYRITRNIVFVRGTAFHDNEKTPLAHCLATFMRLGSNNAPEKDAQAMFGADKSWTTSSKTVNEND